jgi:hypothetical protein
LADNLCNASSKLDTCPIDESQDLKTKICHLEYFVVIWYVSPRFGIWYQEKSGNPGLHEQPKTVHFLASIKEGGMQF